MAFTNIHRNKSSNNQICANLELSGCALLRNLLPLMKRDVIGVIHGPTVIEVTHHGLSFGLMSLTTSEGTDWVQFKLKEAIVQRKTELSGKGVQIAQRSN